jgi:hypothetical protein
MSVMKWTSMADGFKWGGEAMGQAFWGGEEELGCRLLLCVEGTSRGRSVEAVGTRQWWRASCPEVEDEVKWLKGHEWALWASLLIGLVRCR